MVSAQFGEEILHFKKGKSGFCTIPARVLKKVKINAEYKIQKTERRLDCRGKGTVL